MRLAALETLGDTGRYQTGSIAALVTSAAPPGSKNRPSGTSRPPLSMASAISGSIT